MYNKTFFGKFGHKLLLSFLCGFHAINTLKRDTQVLQFLVSSVAFAINNIDGCGLNNKAHHEFLPKDKSNSMLADHFIEGGILTFVHK